jgi:hypothetical protein
MKAKNMLVFTLIALVAFLSSGCVAFSVNGANKKGWRDADGSVHTRGSSWNITDPWSAFKDSVNLNCQIAVLPQYGSGQNGGSQAGYYDYEHHTYCPWGEHIEELFDQQGNKHRYTVPDGSHVEWQNGVAVNVKN